MIGSLAAALFLGAYIPFVFVPVTTEALRLTTQRRKSFSLTTAIDRGEIQVNSATYWMAIERMTDTD